MSEQAHRGKLAYKFLFWFLLVSLAPIAVIGWTLVTISQSALIKQTLAAQEAQANGFADTVWNYVNTYKAVLFDEAHSAEFAGAGAGVQGPALERQDASVNQIMQTHAAILEVSIFDVNGVELLRKGRFLGAAPVMRNFADEPAFQSAMQKGEFVGNLERVQGLYPTITVAVSVEEARGTPPKRTGVLLGKVSLNGLSHMLTQQYPEGGTMEAAVVGTDGFLVAHSRPKAIFRPDAKLPREITDVILTQTTESGHGEIPLSDGTKLLGAYARVKEYWWVVYVQQPRKAVYAAIDEMQGQIVKVLLWVIAVTILLSLAVAGHITQPIRLLRQAADRLGRGEFEELPEMVTTNDEIGDLAQAFLQMWESLREKTGELSHAKGELEKWAKTLESRVAAKQRELKAAQDELIKKERLAAIGQMASVVSHEIRNPLAVIKTSAYLIKSKLSQAGEGAVDPKLTKHLAIIESEIQQANGIIDEILSFSRTKALNPVVLSINNFLEEILSLHPFPSNVRVAREFDARNPVVNIDPDEMRQAVRNLIGNAVEVMAEGGTLRLGTEIVEGSWVRVDIADTGPGIPPDILEKIFAPFFTTKARGTGLGLAVVRKVVDRHLGKVDVESEVGKGTMFHIYLPLASKAPAAAGASERSAPAGLAPPPKRQTGRQEFSGDLAGP